MTQPPPEPDTDSYNAPVVYGTFNNRMIAIVADLFLLYMIALPLVDLIVAHFFAPIDMAPILAAIESSKKNTDVPGYIKMILHALVEQHAIQRVIVENLLQIFFVSLYVLPFWFRFSSTPGKMLLRLEIQDDKTRRPMSRVQAVVRFFSYIISVLPLSLGFTWMLVDRKHRGFHDLIARTVVVKRPKTVQIEDTPEETPAAPEAHTAEATKSA